MELGKARRGGWREQNEKRLALGKDGGSLLEEEARDGGGNKEGDGEKTRQRRVQQTRGDDDC